MKNTFLKIKYLLHKQLHKRYKCEIKVNTMVKFDYDRMPKEYWSDYKKIFPKYTTFVFLGELVQMPGHCIVCNYTTGQIVCGYHTENFIPLTKEEV